MAEAAVLAEQLPPHSLDPTASTAMSIDSNPATNNQAGPKPAAPPSDHVILSDLNQPPKQGSLDIPSTQPRSFSIKSQSESRSRSPSSHSLSRSRSASLSRSPSRSRSLSGSRTPSQRPRRGRDRGRPRIDAVRSPRRNPGSPPRTRRTPYGRSRSDDEAYAEALRGASAPTFNVFVRTVPDHATESDLHEAFKDFGEIFSTKIVIPAASRRRSSAPSSGPTSAGAYGFVNFVTEQGQRNALDAAREGRIELSGIVLDCKVSDGSTVISVTNIPSGATRSDFRYLIRKEVGRYHAVSFQGRQSFVVYSSFYEAEKAIRKINDGGGLRLNGTALCAAVASEAKSRRGQGIRESPNERTIFVAKVPAEIGVEDLRSHFAVYGEITSVRLAGGNTSGRGYAFVEFANSGDSEIAYREAQDSDLKGFRLQLDWCRDSSRNSGNGSGSSSSSSSSSSGSGSSSAAGVGSGRRRGGRPRGRAAEGLSAVGGHLGVPLDVHGDHDRSERHHYNNHPNNHDNHNNNHDHYNEHDNGGAHPSNRNGRSRHRDGYESGYYHHHSPPSSGYRRGRLGSRERDARDGEGGGPRGSHGRGGHSPPYAHPPPYYMPPPFMYHAMMDPKMFQRMGLFPAGHPMGPPPAHHHHPHHHHHQPPPGGPGNPGAMAGSGRDSSVERDHRGGPDSRSDPRSGPHGMRPPHGMDFARMMPYSAAYMAAAAAAHHPWISAAAHGDRSPPHGNGAMGRRHPSSYDRHAQRRGSGGRRYRSPTRSWSRSRSPRRRR